MSNGAIARDLRRFYHRLSRRSHSSTSSAWTAYPTAELMLQTAQAYIGAEQCADLSTLVARKTEAVRNFDIAGMQSAVAICTYGGSGSMLLASYLDGHDDVIALPVLFSQAIYPFFQHYQSLPLRDKLLAYPFFSEPNFDDFERSFSRDDTRIRAVHYYAAVDALLKVYGDRPASFLQSRRTFFVFVHVAHCVALGRHPAIAAPLIVYGQHIWDDDLATRFVEDFQQARFIHTVRDPISNCSRHLARYTGNCLAAALVVSHLTYADVPHTGMEHRTRAIRFEDLHLHLGETMRSLAAWLGLPYQNALLESSFNGVPYVATRGTSTWSGPRPEQAVRDTKNVSFTDRSLLYAVLYEDFVAWNYPCPKAFAHASVRVLVALLFLLLPMRIEIITAKLLIRSLPTMSLGNAVNGFARIIASRAAIIVLLGMELGRRLVARKTVLTLRQGNVLANVAD
jgi:hypothetical protein